MKKISFLLLIPLLVSCGESDGYVRCESITSSKGLSWSDREMQSYKIAKYTFSYYTVSTTCSTANIEIRNGIEVLGQWHLDAKKSKTEKYTDKSLSSFFDKNLIDGNSLYVHNNGKIPTSPSHVYDETTEIDKTSNQYRWTRTVKTTRLIFSSKEMGTYIDCTNIFYNPEKAMIKIVDYNYKKKDGVDAKILNGKTVFLMESDYAISNERFKFQYTENETYYHVVGDETIEFVPYKK